MSAFAVSSKPGQQAILIAGGGSYSFKGSGYVRGGIFDRIELEQDGSGIRFRDRNHERLGAIEAQGAPALREISLFTVPDELTLDPTQPWEIELLVQRATGAREKAFLEFELTYTLPERYIKREREATPVATGNAVVSKTAPAETGRSVVGRRASVEADVAARGSVGRHYSAGHRRANRNLLLPEHARAKTSCLYVGPARLSRVHVGLAWLVRECATLRRQRTDVHECARDRL